MIAAVHQPEYFPWLGLLHKARRADVLVLLDDVQFNRASLQHRCKVASPREAFKYLTIPFRHAHPQLIRDVVVADQSWRSRHVASLEDVYQYAPAFDHVMSKLRSFFESEHGTVAGAAKSSMELVFDAFGVKTPVVAASSLNASGKKGDRVLDLCRLVGADRYLSGAAGASYLDAEAFEAAGVSVEVSSFPTPRRRDGRCLVDGLSALDAWMYLGDHCAEALEPLTGDGP